MARSAGIVVAMPSMRDLLERPDHAGDGGGAVLAPHDELADEVVVVLADLVAGLVAAVPADAEALRGDQLGDRAGGGEELAAGRVLGVDAHLDGVAAEVDVVLGEATAARREATRICSRTRSMPDTSSVTGCSTWRRVFISRKQNSPSW